ncbi:hypothetical protein SprV_0200567300 [Sparganum proliferum]
MRPKDQLPATEQSAVVYSIPCQDCSARYVGETGKRLCTRLHGHQLAVNREDKLSLVYGHVQQEKQSFAFGEASVIGRASDKMARLVLESWSSVDTINRAIDLHPAYQALRTRFHGKPSTLSDSVRDGNDGFIVDNSAKVEHWREHFKHHVHFDTQPTSPLLSSAVEFLPSPTYTASCGPPSKEDVADYIRRLRNNKAPAEDGIPAEMYKSCVDTGVLAP